MSAVIWFARPRRPLEITVSSVHSVSHVNEEASSRRLKACHVETHRGLSGLLLGFATRKNPALNMQAIHQEALSTRIRANTTPNCAGKPNALSQGLYGAGRTVLISGNGPSRLLPASGTTFSYVILATQWTLSRVSPDLQSPLNNSLVTLTKATCKVWNSSA